MPVVDLSHPLEQISERGLLPKRPFPGPANLPLVGGAFYLWRWNAARRPRRPAIASRPVPAHAGLTSPGRGNERPVCIGHAVVGIILRAVVVYAVVLGMVRLSGKRALGQITPFDVLLIVLLGNAVQNALLGEDTSLGGGLLLAATLISINYGVGWLSTRSRRVETLVEGEPILIARDGKVLDSVLRRELVTPADLDAAMRQQGCLSIDDVALAVLEINGHITIVPKK